MLAARGFELIEEAADGNGALSAVARACPDAILLDINLPGRDGLAVAASLAFACPRTTIMLTSSEVDQELGQSEHSHARLSSPDLKRRGAQRLARRHWLLDPGARWFPGRPLIGERCLRQGWQACAMRRQPGEDLLMRGKLAVPPGSGGRQDLCSTLSRKASGCPAVIRVRAIRGAIARTRRGAGRRPGALSRPWPGW